MTASVEVQWMKQELDEQVQGKEGGLVELVDRDSKASMPGRSGRVRGSAASPLSRLVSWSASQRSARSGRLPAEAWEV